MDNIGRVRSGVLVAVLSLGGLIACGGGSSNPGDPTIRAQEDPVSISGTAVKGLVKKAHAKAYSVVNGAKGLEVASGMTSEIDGRYALTVNDYTGPLIIEISSLSTSETGFPSVMRCDIAQCSDTVAFGQDYDLDPGFVLSAVVSNIVSGASVSANVTALTHLAAAYAVSLPGGYNSDSIGVANSQVADLFDLTGNIVELDVVDITDADSLSAASAEAKQAALISAALLAAGLNGASIETSLDAISSDFVTQSGQLVINDGAASGVSLLDIYEQSLAIIGLAPGSDLFLLQTELAAKQTTAMETSEGTQTNAKPDESVTSDALKAAKNFIADIRDVWTYISDDDTGQNNEVPEAFRAMDTQGRAFQDQLDLVSNLVDTDMEMVSEAIWRAGQAIDEAAEMYEDLAEPVSMAFTASNGIDVVIDKRSANKYDVSFSINETVDVQVNGNSGPVAVNLTASLGDANSVLSVNETSTDLGNGSIRTVGDADIDLLVNISGTVANSGVELTINEGTLDVNWKSQFDETETQTTDEYSFTADASVSSDLDFDLRVTISQLGADDPVSFEGQFRFAYTNFEFTATDDELVTYGPYVSTETEVETLSVDTFSVVYGGSFSNVSGDSVKATFSTDLKAPITGFQNTYKEDHNNGTFTDSNISTEETATAFLAVNMVLVFEAELQGIDNTTEVTFSGTREEFEKGTASLELGFNGKSIKGDLDINREAANDDVEWSAASVLTLTNQASVVIALNVVEEGKADEEITGTITSGGSVVAEISEPQNDVILIRYSDGTTETLQ